MVAAVSSIDRRVTSITGQLCLLNSRRLGRRRRRGALCPKCRLDDAFIDGRGIPQVGNPHTVENLRTRAAGRGQYQSRGLRQGFCSLRRL